jgi:hypothetical protein
MTVKPKLAYQNSDWPLLLLLCRHVLILGMTIALKYLLHANVEHQPAYSRQVVSPQKMNI